MAQYKEIVKGRIVSKSGSPVANAAVKVLDKDLILDDDLGSTTTDRDGRFRVEFKTLDFSHGGLEGRPDIFLEIRSPGGKKTKSRVFEELTGVLSDDDSEEVMDLGDVVVES